MPKILQLDRHVADLIAAGEVVERPASAAKELMENALDAGATQVTVEIQNGGMTYLRVTDNGCGIAPEDAETAFLRHATSKLRTKEDLAAIGTLGFRGEALAAIAAVSKIDLLTKTAQGEGISLRLEAGKVLDKSPAGCPEGTTIVVRELFYNTPARLKFLKRDTVEAARVAGEVQRQALAHPEVSFRLIRDGEPLLKTAGNGDLHGAIYQVYGRQLAADMVPVESQWENLSLSGFVTKPTATRGNRSCQQFFVNGRPVLSKLMTAALEEAYANQMMTGRFPSCVLRLTLPNSAVDVNVHPAKTEVKFSNERAVFDCVRYGVMAALRRDPARPELKLPQARAATVQSAAAVPTAAPRTAVASAAGKTVEPRGSAVAGQALLDTLRAVPPAHPAVARAMDDAPPAGEAVLRQPVLTPGPGRSEAAIPAFVPPMPRAAAPQSRAPAPNRAAAPWQPTTRAEMPASEPAPQAQPATQAQPAPQSEAAEPEQTALELPRVQPYRVVGEVLDTYILIEQDGAVLFLDKHAAHERILFEKLRKSQEPVMAQVLLSPMAASLSREEAAAVLEQAELLEEYGYQVEDFGDGTVLLRQIPADLPESEAEAALQALAQALLEGHSRDPNSLRDALLHTIACKAAIKGGWHTRAEEREHLVREVMERDDIRCCPHGRPVLLKLTKNQLERQFGRA